MYVHSTHEVLVVAAVVPQCQKKGERSKYENSGMGQEPGLS